jgi:rare lipoprotein A
MVRFFLCFAIVLISNFNSFSQKGGEKADQNTLFKAKKYRILYGVASYYSDRFDGNETANGEIYDHNKMTAACNVLPLGTVIRVTNLSNNRSVIVHTNDRLHIRMKRIVDLSRTAAEKLGYVKKGLTNVKVEILEKE